VGFAAPLAAWFCALFSQRESARKPQWIADCQAHPDSRPGVRPTSLTSVLQRGLPSGSH
jgi:hypothetical protein